MIRTDLYFQNLPIIIVIVKMVPIMRGRNRNRGLTYSKQKNQRTIDTILVAAHVRFG